MNIYDDLFMLVSCDYQTFIEFSTRIYCLQAGQTHLAERFTVDEYLWLAEYINNAIRSTHFTCLFTEEQIAENHSTTGKLWCCMHEFTMGRQLPFNMLEFMVLDLLRLRKYILDILNSLDHSE